MKLQRNKTLSTTALILILAVSALMTHMPTTNAADVQTYAFLTASPNPVGRWSDLTIVMWLNLPPPTATGAAGDRWQPLTVTVTKPDGTTQTLGPFKSDPVGSQYTSYVPDQLGTYYFEF